MKCKKCDSKMFRIDVIECCSDCSENAAYDEDEEGYTYDEKTIHGKGLTRDQVDQDGECSFGNAFGEGCYMFICAGCSERTNLAVSDSC